MKYGTMVSDSMSSSKVCTFAGQNVVFYLSVFLYFILPLTRVRVDRGGFDQDNFEQWENDNIEYVAKVKMYNSVHKIIDYVNQNNSQFPWQEIDKTFSVTEITVPLPSWKKARRFILIHKKLLEAPNGQLALDGDWFRYEYQAIVTNIDYLTPEEVFYD